MSTKKIRYEVWTVHNENELGVLLYSGTWKECNAYVDHITEKWVSGNDFAIILSDSDIKKEQGRD